MKPNNLITSLVLITTIIMSLTLPSTVASQSASTSADIDEIKENVKQRIQDVVKIKGEKSIILTPIAFTGKLLSLANDTLTIETISGVKLASVSASTTYAKLPEGTLTQLDEVAIEDYVLALGYLNGTDVLDTRRVLTQKTIPTPSEKRSLYGKLSYNEEEDLFSLTPYDSQDPLTLRYNRNSDIFYETSLDQRLPFDADDPVPTNAVALAIFSESSNSNPSLVSTMLIRTPPDSPQESTATSSASTIPAELRQ
jgi:hypothetical protein